MTRVRLDWEIAKRGWRRYAAYPWATVAGAFTNTIFGFLQAYILLAVYRHRADVGGFDAADAVTYVWLAQSMIMTVYIFSWWELAWRIRDGSIATDLLRPLEPAALLARVRPRPRAVPLPVPRPAAVRRSARSSSSCTTRRRSTRSRSSSASRSPSSSASAFRFIYNSVAFWLLDFRGVVTLSTTDRRLLLRHGDPAPLLPGRAARELCYALPFGSMIQTPIDIWLGKRDGRGARRRARAAARSGRSRCSALGQLVLRRATRKVVVQGG